MTDDERRGFDVCDWRPKRTASDFRRQARLIWQQAREIDQMLSDPASGKARADALYRLACQWDRDADVLEAQHAAEAMEAHKALPVAFLDLGVDDDFPF